MTEQSCRTCKWFKKFHETNEYGQCGVMLPFWCYLGVQFMNRPDLNENEGKDCAAWEGKSVQSVPSPHA